MAFVPLKWLADLVDVVPGSTPEDVAAALVKVGLEEEGVHGSGVTGPLVVGRVLTAEKETHKNGKSIQYCRVDVGQFNDPAGPSENEGGAVFPASRGIVCGAHNFGAGDWVVVALPGAVLPGDFAISARKTYGHVSDGMICSARELDLGDDHTGIIVLTSVGYEAASLTPGQDALALLGLGDVTLEVNVTPDRGYCFSMRGVAREYAHSTGAAFHDPALAVTVSPVGTTPGGFAVEIEDGAPIRGREGCSRFAARIVRGIDPTRPSPDWMQNRLRQMGMRPISLAVDVSNYVMLELGQPIGIYDAQILEAPIVVRRAKPSEPFITLDAQDLDLDGEDLLITDSPGGSRGSRILGLAGVKGGASSGVTEATTDVLIEAAHFDAVSLARSARRHRLPTESARRFERGVDPGLPAIAAQRCVDLLVEFGGGVADGEATDLESVPDPIAIVMEEELPDRIVGVEYAPGEVHATLEAIGCAVTRKGATLVVVPPSWRPDLKAPIDLVEEVARLHGYEELPSVLPVAPPGRGLTHAQKVRRAVARTLAERGFVEVLTYPFVSPERFDDLQIPEGDKRRDAVRLANPLAADSPLLRTRVLFTLVDAVRLNVGRGATDVAVFEVGCGYIADGTGVAPHPGIDGRPADAEVAALDAALPSQPQMVAGVMAGDRVAASWDGPAVPFSWTDAISAVEAVADAAGVTLTRRADAYAPWHPGRTAVFTLADGRAVAHAGELHPKVCETMGLPARTVAFQVLLEPVIQASEGRVVQAEPVRTPPLAREDFAFVVDAALPSAALVATVREAAGDLLEDARVFDVFTGAQVGEGKKSVAVTLVLRASDRTLTAEEILAVRQEVISAAGTTHGAALRA